MGSKTYCSAERDLTVEWAKIWLRLFYLINEVTGTDEPPHSPPPPDDADEIQYQSPRFWLIDHQEQFMPLWKDYFDFGKQAYVQDCTDEDIDDLEDQDRYFESPFLEFYEAENLYRLAIQLGLQSSTDLWEPSEYQALSRSFIICLV